MEPQETTLIFISGLAADERSFVEQRNAFPNSLTLKWIPVLPRESLEEYALRLADSLDRRPKSCCVVGLSLGGMLAPYVAERLGAKMCILLASVRSPRELPERYRFPGWFAQHATWLVRAGFVVGKGIIWSGLPIFRLFCRKSRVLAMTQLCDCDSWRFAQLLRMLTEWGYNKRKEKLPKYDFPIYHLHGDHDPVLPLVPESADEVIPHCGHLVPLSHPEVTNRFIRECLLKNCSDFAQ